MKKILIATDGSEPSREAVQFGLELAEEHAAEVTFVHVVPVLDRSFADGIGVPAAMPHQIDELDRKPLEDALALAAERDVDARAELLAGIPADEIVAFADTLDADLIVLGSRGRGRAQEGLLGSVNGYIHFHAKVPLLTVPPRDGDADLAGPEDGHDGDAEQDHGQREQDIDQPPHQRVDVRPALGDFLENLLRRRNRRPGGPQLGILHPQPARARSALAQWRGLAGVGLAS